MLALEYQYTIRLLIEQCRDYRTGGPGTDYDDIIEFQSFSHGPPRELYERSKSPH